MQSENVATLLTFLLTSPILALENRPKLSHLYFNPTIDCIVRIGVKTYILYAIECTCCVQSKNVVTLLTFPLLT